MSIYFELPLCFFSIAFFLYHPYMNYGYIRVSSDKQTVENQRFEINNFCKKEGIIIDGWIEETISGTTAGSSLSPSQQIYNA